MELHMALISVKINYYSINGRVSSEWTRGMAQKPGGMAQRPENGPEAGGRPRGQGKVISQSKKHFK